jgi:hypothetical protein
MLLPATPCYSLLLPATPCYSLLLPATPCYSLPLRTTPTTGVLFSDMSVRMMIAHMCERDRCQDEPRGLVLLAAVQAGIWVWDVDTRTTALVLGACLTLLSAAHVAYLWALAHEVKTALRIQCFRLPAQKADATKDAPPAGRNKKKSSPSVHQSSKGGHQRERARSRTPKGRGVEGASSQRRPPRR